MSNRPLTGLPLMEAWLQGPRVWTAEAPPAAGLNRSVLQTAEREKADGVNRNGERGREGREGNGILGLFKGEFQQGKEEENGGNKTCESERW